MVRMLSLLTLRMLMSFPNKQMQRTVEVRMRRNQKPQRSVAWTADAYPRNEA